MKQHLMFSLAKSLWKRYSIGKTDSMFLANESNYPRHYFWYHIPEVFWLSHSLQCSLAQLLEGAILLGLYSIKYLKYPTHCSLNTQIVEVPFRVEMIPAAVGDIQLITQLCPKISLQSVRVVTKGKVSSDWSTLGHRQNQNWPTRGGRVEE